MDERAKHITKLSGGRTADRLAAVQFLLLADRDQKAHDILLATVLERLESGPKTFDELLLQTREAWPGVSLSRPLLRSTIDAAQDAGLLLAVDPGLLTGAAWTLGTTGRQDIEAAQGWAADILDRTASQVADEARRVLGNANTSDVVRWSEILLDVLVAGIAKALTADGGGFRVVGDAYLFPSEYDLDFLDGKVASSCHDPAVADLLRLLVRAALDPARAFATELVHHISTGYVLFAYLGRMHNSGARRTVGSLSGEVAILDTPLLLRLLGGPPGRSAIVDLIGLGLGSGMEIVVHETTLIELDHLLGER